MHGDLGKAVQRLERESGKGLSDIAGLYAAELEEFTAARNELAKKLRQEGATTEAEEIKALKKPSVAAWTVNQLAHRDPEAMRDLLSARDDIKKATDASQMREASLRRRDLIARLVDRAGVILAESGHAATAATMEKVSRTLHAGGTNDERDLLLQGRLTKELEPSAFEDLPGLETAATEEPAPPLDEEAHARVEELSRQADEAEAEAARLEQDAEEAERNARRLSQQALAARRRAARARERAAKASG